MVSLADVRRRHARQQEACAKACAGDGANAAAAALEGVAARAAEMRLDDYAVATDRVQAGRMGGMGGRGSGAGGVDGRPRRAAPGRTLPPQRP